MKLMSFSEINDLENGQQISSFQGTVKKVFDQKSDVGQYGQWWLQNIILQDDHANELTVTWCCEDCWTDKDEGKHLLFEAGRGKKDEIVGIKREIRNKNGKRYESVKVDDRAKVKTLNGDTQGDEHGVIEVEESGGGSTFTRDPDWPEAEKPREHPLNDHGVSEARKHLMQSANLYNLCVAAVDKAIAPNMPQIAQTSEQFQAAVGTLFIEASRSGFVPKMPATPIK